VLLIEHDMSVVMEISDHVVVLDYGEKISDGTPPSSCATTRSVIAAYLGVEDEEVERSSRRSAVSVSAAAQARRGVTTFYGKIIALRGVDLDVRRARSSR
jgi:energy-coupling factor transporter ATP-binding protein EcfA2